MNHEQDTETTSPEQSLTNAAHQRYQQAVADLKARLAEGEAQRKARLLLEYKSIDTGARVTVSDAHYFADENNYEIEYIKFSRKNFSDSRGLVIGETEDTVIGKLFVKGDILFSSDGAETYKRVGTIENGEARRDNQDVSDLILGKFDKYLRSNLERMIKKKAELQEKKAKKQEERRRKVQSMFRAKYSST